MANVELSLSNIEALLTSGEKRKGRRVGHAPAPEEADLTESVEALEQQAVRDGLDSATLARVASCVAADEKGDKLTCRLLWCMIPSGEVPHKAVVTLAATLGRATMSLRVAICQWLVLVLDLVDDVSTVKKLFSVFFHYLDYETLRPFLCNILSRIARHGDVKPWRVRRLAELYHKTGNEPWLLLLMQAFKGYLHSMVVPTGTFRRGGQSNPFKISEARWVQRLVKIQTSNGHAYRPPSLGVIDKLSSRPRDARDMPAPLKGLLKWSPAGGRRRKGQQGADSLLIGVSSSSSLRNPSSAVSNSAVPLADIETVEELVDNLSDVTFPDRMISSLSSRLAQHLLSLRPEAGVAARLSNGVAFELEHSLTDRHRNESGETAGLLLGVVRLTRFMQELIPEVDAVLCRYLKTWNGEAHREAIFELTSYVRPRAFETVTAEVLRPLSALFHSGSPYLKARILRCFTELLRRWAGLDWRGIYEAQGAAPHGDDAQGVRPQATGNGHFLFTGVQRNVNYFRTILELCKFTDHLAAIGLRSSANHALVQHATLCFLDVASSLRTRYQLPMVCPVSPPVVYLLLLSGNPTSVSRLCGACAQFRSEFPDLSAHLEDQKQHGPDPRLPVLRNNGLERTAVFNAFILDLCNALWKHTILETTNDPSRPTFLFDISDEAREAMTVAGIQPKSHNTALSLVSSVAFGSLARKYLKQFEEATRAKSGANAPICAPGIIRGKFRGDYLDFLWNKCHLRGVHEFLHCCISSLVDRRQKRRAADAAQVAAATAAEVAT